MTDDTTPDDKPLWKKWWFWVAAVLVLAVIGSMLPEDETPVAADTTTTIGDTTTTTVEATTTTQTTTTTTTTVAAVDWMAEMEACHADGGCSSFPGIVSIRESGDWLIIEAHKDIALQACRDATGWLAWEGGVDVLDAHAGGSIVRSAIGLAPCEER